MHFVIAIETLYKSNSDPFARDAEWREVAIKSPTFPPRDEFSIEEYSGSTKSPTNAHTATLLTSASLEDARNEFQKAIKRLIADGFKPFNILTQ